LDNSQLDYFRKIKSMQLKSPLMIGFGISNHESFQAVAEYSAGAIVGSAFIKKLKEDASDSAIDAFVKDLKFGSK